MRRNGSVWLSNPPLWQSGRGLWLFPLYELRRSSSILARSPALSPAAGEAAGKLAGDRLLSAGDLFFFFFFLLNPCRAAAPLLSEAVSLTHSSCFCFGRSDVLLLVFVLRARL